MLETIYLVHHSHTDIGYTHDQPTLWDLQRRFIDDAIVAASRDMDVDADHAFRWTVETTMPLLDWLERATDRQIGRFVELERRGRIEVTAMPLNITPLFDAGEIVEWLQPVQRLRDEFGFKIRYAMNCDVNGQNWPLADLLLDMDVNAFSMAINTHFGGYPLCRPAVFSWEAPSGRTLPVYNGFPYESGFRFGIGRSLHDFEEYYLPALQRKLDEVEYPLSALMLQTFHPFGDNGSAYYRFSEFVQRWNATCRRPRIVMATPSMWWDAVEELLPRMENHRGDWTDFWNFGCISSARETEMNRDSRRRLRTADIVSTTCRILRDTKEDHDNGERQDREFHTNFFRNLSERRTEAWRMLGLWDEHTWGAECSVVSPWAEDTLSQWYHKAGYAYGARSRSSSLLRDALAELSQQIESGDATDIMLFNPLPGPLTVTGPINEGIVYPRGVSDDPTSERHWQDRQRQPDALSEVYGEPHSPGTSGASEASPCYLPSTTLPPFGYRVVTRDSFSTISKARNLKYSGDSDVNDRPPAIDNGRFVVVIDEDSGGISSWYDRELNHDWVDHEHPLRFGAFVRETLDRSQVPDEVGPAAARREIFSIDFSSRELEREAIWNPSWPRAFEVTPSNGDTCHAATDSRKPRIKTSIYEIPDGTKVIQQLPRPDRHAPDRKADSDETCATCDTVTLSIFVPKNGEWVEFEAWWHMADDPWPEATYLAFPFNLTDPEVRYDVGANAVMLEKDQLPGCCRDYVTTQGWVDLSDESAGVTIATPGNPMAQFGDFNFGKRQRIAETNGLFLGWITANYWDTNFRASQPGLVHAKYTVHPHGRFIEADAHHFSAESAHRSPVAQHCGESWSLARSSQSNTATDIRPDERKLPESGSLLLLPGHDGSRTPFILLSFQFLNEKSVALLRMVNASDCPEVALVGSAILKIVDATIAPLVGTMPRAGTGQSPNSDGNAFEGNASKGTIPESIRELPIHDGWIACEVEPRRTVTLRLSFSQ